MNRLSNLIKVVLATLFMLFAEGIFIYAFYLFFTVPLLASPLRELLLAACAVMVATGILMYVWYVRSI